MMTMTPGSPGRAVMHGRDSMTVAAASSYLDEPHERIMRLLEDRTLFSRTIEGTAWITVDSLDEYLAARSRARRIQAAASEAARKVRERAAPGPAVEDPAPVPVTATATVSPAPGPVLAPRRIGYSHRGPTYIAEEIAVIVAMWRVCPVEEIADALGRSVGSVLGKASELCASGEMYGPDFMTVKAAAGAMGVSEDTARSLAEKGYIDWRRGFGARGTIYVRPVDYQSLIGTRPAFPPLEKKARPRREPEPELEPGGPEPFFESDIRSAEVYADPEPDAPVPVTAEPIPGPENVTEPFGVVAQEGEPMSARDAAKAFAAAVGRWFRGGR